MSSSTDQQTVTSAKGQKAEPKGDGQSPPKAAPVSASIPAGPAASGAASYVKAEQTANGFRISACVLPGTTQVQMDEAALILMRTLAQMAVVLPTELKVEQRDQLAAVNAFANGAAQ